MASKYVPIEDVLARPKVRILRALRWFGWVSRRELFDALDVTFEHRKAWGSLYSALRGLVVVGCVESVERELRDAATDRVVHEQIYCITDRGRFDLARTMRQYEASVSETNSVTFLRSIGDKRGVAA